MAENLRGLNRTIVLASDWRSGLRWPFSNNSFDFVCVDLVNHPYSLRQLPPINVGREIGDLQ